MRYTYHVGTFLCATLSACSFQSEQADLVLHNATVLTLTGSGEDPGVAQAMAIRGDSIVAVGKEREILNRFRAPEKVDLKGATVMPGLVDPHAHFLGYAEGLTRVDLIGTRSWQEVVDRVVSWGQTHSAPWIEGRGWDQNDWPQTDWPTRAALDSAFPDRPVVLTRIDGHALIANGAALQMASVVPVDGGEILLDAAGEMTGVLIDAAMGPVIEAIPPMDSATRIAALQEVESRLFEVGLTAVVDAGLEVDDLAALEAAYAADLLRIRTWAWAADTPESHAHWLARGPLSTDRFTVQGFKFYMDGALGSRGAVLLAPYDDRPQWSGLRMVADLDSLRDRYAALHEAGFQVATHAIGDSANRVVLDLYAEILGGTNDKRWRIEHAQVVEREDRAKFGELSVIPSVQPTHATSDMNWAGARLGRNRLSRAYAYRSLQAELGMIALGTDFPVEDIDPRKTYFAAVARRDRSGQPRAGFLPDEALTPIDAIRGMTIWAAIASFEEDRLGTLEPGKRADLTVVDRNWLTTDPAEVLESRILGTMIAGKWVYQDLRK